MNDEILEAVKKRAVGYSSTETVEEYAAVDGKMELVKRRVTVKDVPPDMAAAKLLLGDGEVEELSDEQLAAEKRRLLDELLLEKQKDPPAHVAAGE